MLSTALGFSGDMSHRSVLALEVLGFSQGLLQLKGFCEARYNSVLLNIMENMT